MMAQRFVGIDLGAFEVKVAVIASTLRGIQVLHVYEVAVDTEGGSDYLGAALDAAVTLLAELGLRDLPVGVSLPGGSGSYRVIGFPFSDAKRVAQTIGFEVDGQFPLPLEELAYDHVMVPRSGKGSLALVVASRSVLVERVVRMLRDCGLDLRLVTVGSLATAQALQGVSAKPEPDSEFKPAALIVDLGHRTTELVALADKGPVAARTLRRGSQHLEKQIARHFKLSPEEAREAKHKDAFLPVPGLQLSPEQKDAAMFLNQVMQPLVREIDHTRQWLRSQYQFLVTEIRLVGGGSQLKGIQPWLEEQTGLSVGLVQPKESFGLRGVADREWTRTIAALGAAIGTARRPFLQLYDGEVQDAGDGWLMQKMPTVAALGVAVLAFAGVDTIAQVRALEAERDAYAVELEATSRQMLGEALTDIDAVRMKLASVESEDLTSRIPSRGALEVLEFISHSSVPSAGSPAAPGAGEGDTDGEGADPSGAPAGGLGAEAGADPGGAAGEETGIVAEDGLVFASVDIRELKIDMKMRAHRATAQDRLALTLQKAPCIGAINKGKIRQRNEREEFEMSVEHHCFNGELKEASE